MDRGLFPRLTELGSTICAPRYCRCFLLEEGANASQTRISKVGITFPCEGCEIEVIRALHGSQGHLYYPDEADQDRVACGYLLRTRYGNILHPGDSYYLKETAELEVEYLLLPINDTNLGVGGMYAPPGTGRVAIRPSTLLP